MSVHVGWSMFELLKEGQWIDLQVKLERVPGQVKTICNVNYPCQRSIIRQDDYKCQSEQCETGGT